MGDRPLRVALLTHSVNPRGGVVHALELGNALHNLGAQVTIVAPALRGQRMFRSSPCDIDLAPFDVSGARSFYETVQSRIAALRTHLAGRLTDDAFDVVHAHDGLGANAMLDLRDDGLRQPLFRTVHHVDHFADPRVQALETRSILGADRVLCVSETWRERLRDQWRIDAAQVANGVDLMRFTPQCSSRDAALAERLGLRGRPVVLAVGGIEARKNSHALLQAFVGLRAQFAHAQLVIAGGASLLDHDAESRRFAVTADESGLTLGVGGDIVLSGVLHDDDMPSLYRTADVLAMPSIIEGFGLAALEARACGVPAVVSQRAPFTEHFGPQDVQWCDPDSVTSITDALRRAIADRSRERPAVCDRFAWTDSARRHIELYRELVEQRSSSRSIHARNALPAALA